MSSPTLLILFNDKVNQIKDLVIHIKHLFWYANDAVHIVEDNFLR